MAKDTGWGMHSETFPQQELRHLPTFAKVDTITFDNITLKRDLTTERGLRSSRPGT